MNVEKHFRGGILIGHKINGEPQPVSSQPTSADWPLWAKFFKACAQPGDRGIGDVIARLIGHETGEAFKMWHKATFGKECGCDGRQAYLNQKYPLK